MCERERMHGNNAEFEGEDIMILFTKPNCRGCDFIRSRIDTDSIDQLSVYTLPGLGEGAQKDHIHALSEADFYDVFTVPCLVQCRDTGFKIHEPIKIVEVLNNLTK